jgi:superfamily I DNA/RNA helicase
LVTFKTSGVLQFEAAPLLEDLDNNDTFGGKRDKTKRILAFEAAWARLQSDEPGWPHDAVDQQFQTDLEDWLVFHNAMLIGELVSQALQYLRANPAAEELARYDHVIVDEYQDLNKAEQVLIDVLANGPGQLIVGDKDQSIYSFRHAHPDGIIEFSAIHAGTHDEILLECRRCPTRVVAMADSLILRNYPAGTAARLRPLAGKPEGEVHIVQWPSLDDEAHGLAKFVETVLARGTYGPADVLILTPRRRIGYAIRDALIARDIATHSFYHEEMLESDGAQRAFCLLQLLVNPEDRVALRFWLGLDSPSWRSGEYARLRQYCVESGQSPWDVLIGLADQSITIKGTNGILARFKELRAELEALQPLVGADLIDYLFPDEEGFQAIRESAQLVNEEAGANTLLESLRTAATQPEMPTEGDFVRIMSLHKSKGLTSKVVIIAGCLDGLIPTIDTDEPLAIQQTQLEEQRRLFYVAMTRATDILTLSSAIRIERNLAYQIGVRVRGWGKNVPAISSRFLNELGAAAPAAKFGPDWIRKGFAI